MRSIAPPASRSASRAEIGAVLTVTDRDARSEYLDRIRRELTRYGMRQRMPAEWSLRRRLLVRTYGAFAPIFMRKNPFGQRKRDLGLDWPAEAETMIGMQRLTSLQHCVETVSGRQHAGRSGRMWRVARRGQHS